MSLLTVTLVTRCRDVTIAGTPDSCHLATPHTMQTHLLMMSVGTISWLLIERLRKDEVQEQQLWGDEEGGGGCAEGQRCGDNPAHVHGPSDSVEGVFGSGAVAVDSVPCAKVGR